MHFLLAQPAPPAPPPTGTPALDPWLLAAALGAAILIVLLLISPRLFRRSAAPPLSRPLARTQGQPERTIARDLQMLMQEVSEMAKRVGGQLDARAARLEGLIRQADERLAMLKEMEKSSAKPLAPQEHEPATNVTIGQPIAPADDPDAIDPRYVEIYVLADQGFSLPQIAERLHRPTGEVELILALKPRARAGV